MAVNIHTEPIAFSPSDNPLMFRFSSTQTAQANFSYIVKTFLNSVEIGEDRVFPESGIYAHYDCSPIVRGLMPSPTFSTALWQNSGTNSTLYITVTEEYGTPPALQASATSSTVKIFKGRLSDKAWESFNAATTWQNLLFLTNYPRTQRIEVLRGTPVYLNMITDASKQLEIKLYNGATLLDSYTDTQNYVIAQLNLNTTNLIATAGFSSGDVALATHYTVQIGTSEILTLYFYDDYCNTPSTIQWLNDYGAFDSFIFAHNLERNSNVKDRSYSKQFGGWVGTSFTYDSNESGERRVGTSVVNEGIAYTDWIKEAQQQWLVELYRSPLHRIYTEGVASSIKVTTNAYSFKQQRFEELISESVGFVYSYNHQSMVL